MTQDLNLMKMDEYIERELLNARRIFFPPASPQSQHLMQSENFGI